MIGHTHAVDAAGGAAEPRFEGFFVTHDGKGADATAPQELDPHTHDYGVQEQLLRLLSSDTVRELLVKRDDGIRAPETTVAAQLPATALGSDPLLLATTAVPSTLLTITSSASLLSGSLSRTSSNPSSATHPPFSDLAPGGQQTATSPAATSSSSNTIVTDLTSTPSNPDLQRNTSLVNYFFVFLGLFVILLIVAIYFIHKRKRAIKAQSRHSGQNALARDLEGWVTTRRWVHGGWRGGESGYVRREEGLNELGEAPPPYQPRQEQNSHTATVTDEAAVGVPTPLRTLSRNGRTSVASARRSITPWPSGEQQQHESPRPPSYPNSPRDAQSPVSVASVDLFRPNTRF